MMHGPTSKNMYENRAQTLRARRICARPHGMRNQPVGTRATLERFLFPYRPLARSVSEGSPLLTRRVSVTATTRSAKPSVRRLRAADHEPLADHERPANRQAAEQHA